MHEYGSHVFKENQIITFIFFFQWKDIFILTKTTSDTVSWSARRGNLTEPTFLLWFISLKYYKHVLQARSSSEHHFLYGTYLLHTTILVCIVSLYIYCNHNPVLCCYTQYLPWLILHCTCQHFYQTPIMLCCFQTDNDDFIFFFYQNIY